MHTVEKQRVLEMVAEGHIRPDEGAALLRAMEQTEQKVEEAPKTTPAAPKPAAEIDKTVEIRYRRDDGSDYIVKVPPSLAPMLWQTIKVAAKESARSAARDVWGGMKSMTRRRAAEIKASMKARNKELPPSESDAAPAESVLSHAAERTILSMVQEGRLSAEEAGRLLDKMGASC